jgi:hypothetical protein
MPENKNGMNWIRQERRLAIYLRDGLACVWCQSGIEAHRPHHSLTLDHLNPALGHATTNLITSCNGCNQARRQMSMRAFAETLRYTAHEDPVEVLRRIRRQRRKPIDVQAAREMIKARGGTSRRAMLQIIQERQAIYVDTANCVDAPNSEMLVSLPESDTSEETSECHISRRLN